jgi:hypothetical protein
MLNDREIVFRFPAKALDFSLLHSVQTGSGAHPAGEVSKEVKRPGREADNSPATSAEAMNTRNYASIPPYIFIMWCLINYLNKLQAAIPTFLNHTAMR